MIITFGGIKGGAGKTLLATNIACMAAHSGARVLLVDTDNQHSAVSWSDARNARTDKLPELVTVSMRGAHAGKEIQKLSAAYDYTVVDTDGQDGGSQRSAILVSDLLLSPFQPRAADVWTVEFVAELVRGARTVNHSLRAFGFLNRADSRGAQNDEAAAALTAYSDVLPLAPVRIGDRKAFTTSWQEGLGICEVRRPDVKALAEITSLWTIIKEL